jgi:hypothetical protein
MARTVVLLCKQIDKFAFLVLSPVSKMRVVSPANAGVQMI